MSEEPLDLIPVVVKFSFVPKNRRKSQVHNFLHRGPVTFDTLVYDNNVGDINFLYTYFNPAMMSERELNIRFGVYPTNGEKHASPKEREEDEFQVKFKSQEMIMRMRWEQETDRNSSGESGKSTPDPETLREWGLQVKRDTSMPPPTSGSIITMPVNYILDSLSWTDNENGKFLFSFYVHLCI